MWYAVISEDHDDSLEKRLAVRAEHVARLKSMCDEGRLLIAGPHPAVDSPDPGPAGFTGSLLVVEFESLEGARKWANDDVYVSVGVYKQVTVKPFNLVLP